MIEFLAARPLGECWDFEKSQSISMSPARGEAELAECEIAQG